MSSSPQFKALGDGDDDSPFRCPGCLSETPKRNGVLAKLRAHNLLLTVHQAVRPRNALHVADIEFTCHRHTRTDEQGQRVTASLDVGFVLSLGAGMIERAAPEQLLPGDEWICPTCDKSGKEVVLLSTGRHHPLLHVGNGTRPRGSLPVADIDCVCSWCKSVVAFTFSLALPPEGKQMPPK